MNIDEPYIRSLPADPRYALWKICDDFYAEGIKGKGITEDELEKLAIDVLALLQIHTHKHKLQDDYFFDDIQPKGYNEWVDGFLDTIAIVRNRVQAEFKVSSLEQSKANIGMLMGTEFFYTFTDGDLDKIQKLLEELRRVINETGDIQADHKSRILRRLQKLESELKKNMSDLDRFYGLLVEASVLAEKIGKHSKPIVQLIRTIVNIVWNTQSRAEELPSDSHFALPETTEEENKV
ncbi:MAG: hypothetical protein AAF558_12305 [Verrucomicrobiota bacterium]